MPASELVQNGGLLLALVWAAWADWTQSRVPNRLTLPLFGLGLVASSAWAWPWPVAWGSALAGVLLAAVVCLPLYGLKWLGAGDAKLAMALGVWLGAPVMGRLLLAWFLCSGVLALVLLARHLYFSGAAGFSLRQRQVVPHAVSLLMAFVLLRAGGAWLGAG